MAIGVAPAPLAAAPDGTSVVGFHWGVDLAAMLSMVGTGIVLDERMSFGAAGVAVKRGLVD